MSMPNLPRAPLEQRPPAESPQTAIAPPQDLHRIEPKSSGQSAPISPAGTAPTLQSFLHAHQVWLELATRAWLRLAGLPMELAGCRSLEAVLELQRRHVTAGVNDALAGYAELAALSGDPLPRRVGAAGVTSTGV